MWTFIICVVVWYLLTGPMTYLGERLGCDGYDLPPAGLFGAFWPILLPTFLVIGLPSFLFDKTKALEERVIRVKIGREARKASGEEGTLTLKEER